MKKYTVHDLLGQPISTETYLADEVDFKIQDLTYNFEEDIGCLKEDLAKKDTKIETLEDIIRMAALNIDERDGEIAELKEVMDQMLGVYDSYVVPRQIKEECRIGDKANALLLGDKNA